MHPFLLVTFVASPLSGYLACWLASNLISAIPKPEELAAIGASPMRVLAYKTAYAFAHLAVGNAARIFPGFRMGAAENAPQGPVDPRA